jgi:predicted RNA-binding protein with PUA-like domain
MAYWLIKSEPSNYSWQQFQKDGKTSWDGVRNYAARNHLQAMRKGDQVFFYHSNEGMEIVGIAEVLKEAYPDPALPDKGWVAVDFKPKKILKRPVTLKEIKKDESLSDMALLRLSRLSVQPVKENEWKIILKKAEEKKSK